MTLRTILKCSLALTVAGMGFTQAHAAVSVSAIKLVKIGDARFWQVTAECDDTSQSLKLRRPEGTREWCSVNFPELCENNKQVLARSACERATGAGDATAAEAEVPAAVEQPAALSARDKLLEEQMQIEERRIEIQQKRLELQSRELELKKRQAGV